jgi:hypothetical protein
VQETTEHPTHIYKLGSTIALLTVVMTVLSVAAYSQWPYAAGVTPTEEIFHLVQDNILAACTALDFGLWVISPLYVFIYLALYFALRPAHPEWALIALALGFIATVSLISTRPVLEIFVLSEQYTAANTAGERAHYLAAGEALLTRFHGSGWHISMFLSAGSHLVSALLMLKSKHFSKLNAWIGVLGFSLALCFWIPVVGLTLLFAAMLFSTAWLWLLGRRLWRMR